MKRIEKLALVIYRDGDWKRRVVEYSLWCDETTMEICKRLKISLPLLNQWHRWHFRTHPFRTQKPIEVLSSPVSYTQKHLNMAVKPTKLKVVTEAERVALLEKEIASLEGALSEARLRAEAMSLMIDLAEKAYKIEIRKKSGAKQLRF
jgi:hypothetical protein